MAKSQVEKMAALTLSPESGLTAWLRGPRVELLDLATLTEAQELAALLPRFEIRWIPRAQNERADLPAGYGARAV